METPIHTINALFEQLGLEGSDAAVEAFIGLHGPLSPAIDICDADFWNASQAATLRQMKEDDADWSEIVDQLDVMLR